MRYPVYDLSKLPDLLTFYTRFSVVILPKDEVTRFITTRLAPNPYWMYSGILTREEVLKTLNILMGKEAENHDLLKKVSYYILFYVENFAFSVWLQYLAMEDIDSAKEYYEWIKPLLEKLRDLAKKEPTRDLINQMINASLEYAIDPL